MDQKDKIIEKLGKSLHISVIMNVIGMVAAFAAIAVYSTMGFPKWSPKSWFSGAPSPEIRHNVPIDSTTKAIARQLSVWQGPDIASAPSEEVRYGHELISNTSQYLGPKGSVAALTNGMNCQNCHLSAGNKVWGNNYGAVASTYPKFRERSGAIEDLPKRVNDCMERSLNGQALALESKELKAMVAYIEWLGHDIPKKEVPNASGIYSVPLLSRAADPAKGAVVYTQKCTSCHGTNGEGVLAANERSYTYPPLWGEHSYNNGAGLYRISRFAGYVKYNMPFGVTWQSPQLSDEECWDVAAFVNSQPRPQKDLSKDWPNLAGKPFDHPFGPYADGFTEKQHKYGPFEPIKKRLKELKGK